MNKDNAANFETTLLVTIDKVNYGGHLAHDSLITMMHEARLQYFDSLGQSEMNFYGAGLILKSLTVNYKTEAFHSELLTFKISISNVSRVNFVLDYVVFNKENNIIATAEINLVSFDYKTRKVIRLPEKFLQQNSQ